MASSAQVPGTIFSRAIGLAVSFDKPQGRPFDKAQGRAFDKAQGRPFDRAQGRPFDKAQGRPASGSVTLAIRLAAVAFVTTLTIAAAQISIPLPFTPVPLTIQPMVVLLGGAALGARLGCASQVAYLVAGIAGLPVFAASPLLLPGVARLLGPTGGYLLSYPLAAWTTGWLAERGLDRRYPGAVAAMGAGLAVIFSFGVAWLAFVWTPLKPATGLVTAVRIGLMPFLVVDVVKVLLAAALLPAVWKLIGRSSPSPLS
ncbi:MAG: biotin transporter BioY [Acidobacteria bacterium]|nr:biotin transporter BioY [Acidobacteriota bacterium]